MKTVMKAAFVATFLLAGQAAFGAQVSIGIQIGPPPPPRVVYVAPVRPAPEYMWVGGYWYPEGKHYKWREGYWVRPPYTEAVWVVPHYSDGRYFAGYWVDKSKGHDKEKKSNGRGRGHNK